MMGFCATSYRACERVTLFPVFAKRCCSARCTTVVDCRAPAHVFIIAVLCCVMCPGAEGDGAVEGDAAPQEADGGGVGVGVGVGVEGEDVYEEGGAVTHTHTHSDTLTSHPHQTHTHTHALAHAIAHTLHKRTIRDHVWVCVCVCVCVWPGLEEGEGGGGGEEWTDVASNAFAGVASFRELPQVRVRVCVGECVCVRWCVCVCAREVRGECARLGDVVCDFSVVVHLFVRHPVIE